MVAGTERCNSGSNGSRRCTPPASLSPVLFNEFEKAGAGRRRSPRANKKSAGGIGFVADLPTADPIPPAKGHPCCRRHRPQQDRVVAFETEFTAVSTCAWCQQHPSTKCRAIATATAVEMMARTVITSFELTNSLGNRQGRRRNVMLILRIFQRYEALVQSTALEDSKSLHQRALTP